MQGSVRGAGPVPGGGAGEKDALHGRRILVIGGTQFMGRLLVEELLRAGARVWILNRGKSPNPFAGDSQVTLLQCDRINDRERFRTLLATPGGEAWDGVVDFVCFGTRMVEDVVSARHCIKHYILISSDSVFMASDRATIRAKQGPAGLKEEDAVEPAGKKALREVKRRNEYQFGYGGRKLACERFLQESASTFPQFTSLRFPDVIGPYDNLGSQLELEDAIRAGSPIGSHIPSEDVPGAAGRISLVFSRDAAASAAAALRVGRRAFGRVLHVAGSERPTFREYAERVSDAIWDVMGDVPGDMMGGTMEDVTRRNVCFDEDEDCGLVSVDVGPISNAAALRVLAPWRPVSLQEMVEETVRWNADPANADYTRRLAASSSSSSSSSSEDANEPRAPALRGGGGRSVEGAGEGFAFNFPTPPASPRAEGGGGGDGGGGAAAVGEEGCGGGSTSTFGVSTFEGEGGKRRREG